MSENKEYRCKSLGCRRVFKWPMQPACYRHGKKCLKPPPVQEQKSYFSGDGVYVCGQCDKTCSHQ